MSAKLLSEGDLINFAVFPSPTCFILTAYSLNTAELELKPSVCQDLRTHLHSFHKFKSSSVVMCKPPRIPLIIKKRALLFCVSNSRAMSLRVSEYKIWLPSVECTRYGGKGNSPNGLMGIHAEHACASLED